MAEIEVTGSRLEEEANGGNRRGLVRCSDLAAQHRRIIYSFGILLKWRRRRKEHCVLRLGLTYQQTTKGMNNPSMLGSQIRASH